MDISLYERHPGGHKGHTDISLYERLPGGHWGNTNISVYERLSEAAGGLGQWES